MTHLPPAALKFLHPPAGNYRWAWNLAWLKMWLQMELAAWEVTLASSVTAGSLKMPLENWWSLLLTTYRAAWDLWCLFGCPGSPDALDVWATAGASPKSLKSEEAVHCSTCGAALPSRTVHLGSLETNLSCVLCMAQLFRTRVPNRLNRFTTVLSLIQPSVSWGWEWPQASSLPFNMPPVPQEQALCPPRCRPWPWTSAKSAGGRARGSVAASTATWVHSWTEIWILDWWIGIGNMEYYGISSITLNC
jgi:hypothetical protein